MINGITIRASTFAGLLTIAVVTWGSHLGAQEAGGAGQQIGTPQSANETRPAATPRQQREPATRAARVDAKPVVNKSLTPWRMFLAADVVVKAVMIGLVAASVIVWTIWLAKMSSLLVLKRRLRRDLWAVAAAASVSEANRALSKPSDPTRHMIELVERELSDALAGDGGTLNDRVASVVRDAEAATSRQLRNGMAVLATIGATAPFVGLFGTVWGIMNSFIGISESQTTNLAVVAPGIAEALLATAIGLIAAIPAVILYNHLGRSIAVARGLVQAVGSALHRVALRQRDGVSVERRVTSLRVAAE